MNIYITKNGQRLGPYSLSEAQAMVNAGTLQPMDLAWYEGLPNWIALQQVPGFASSSGEPVRRPILVWIICLFHFITIPLSVVAIAASPFLLSFAKKTQQQTADMLQTQVDQATDPHERDQLIAMQKELRDNEAKMTKLGAYGPLVYVFSIFFMLVNLVAAILLFRLRRSAYYAFIASVIIDLISTIYNCVRDPSVFVSGIAIFSLVIGWGITIAIIFYVRALARAGVLTTGPVSTKSV